MSADGVDEEAPVIEHSFNQRWPRVGEPVCSICGRYGEYVCDATDDDVCSLECKYKSISGRERLRKAGTASPNHGAGNVETTHPCPVTGNFLSEQQIAAIRSELQLDVIGNNIPPPFVEFSDAGDVIPERLLDNMHSSGIDAPTPVQMQSFPLLLQGRHVVAAAPPGSGKTAAFLLPLLARLANDTQESSAPRILILAGTRELAQQLEEQTKKFAKGLPNVHTALVVGGLPTKPQAYRLQTAAQVVIGTPGKLLDILSQHIKDETFFSEVFAMVLDEADSMVHKEFHDQVMSILEYLPDNVQKLMFSATVNDRLRETSSELLVDPVRLTVGVANMPSASVRQTVIWVEEAAKKNHLFALLRDAKHYTPPVLIFVSRQHGADLLADAIVQKCNITACAVHGGLDQSTRSRLVAQFGRDEFPILVSTPLLGRGIDWPQVKLVINFDMPAKIAEFVHQTGRSGRMGSPGRAVTFINNQSSKLFSALASLLGDSTRLPQQVLVRAQSQPVSSSRHAHPTTATAKLSTSALKTTAAATPQSGKRKSQVSAQSLLDVLKGVHAAKKKPSGR